MGFQVPLAIAGAGLFGALGGIGASRHNSAVERNAIAQQEAINTDIGRLRLNFFDTTRIAAQGLQRGTGNIENALFNGFASGHSLNRVIAARVMDGRRDQEARRTALEYQVESLETQKENIVRQADASMQPVGLAVLQGALQGAQLGASLGGSIDSFQAASARGSFLSDLEGRLGVEGPPDPRALAQLRAFNAGVPVDLLTAGGSIGEAALSPFLLQMQTEALQMQGLQAASRYAAQTAGAAGALLGQAQFRFNQYSNSAFFAPSFAPSHNVLLGR